MQLTTSVDDHPPKLLVVMNAAIVEDDNAPLLGVWVELWALNIVGFL